MRHTYYENKKLTVINFFGGAGVGKSTTAAELFAKMKKANYKVDLAHEVAKDLVWEEAHNIFGEQDYMFALQNRKLRRLIGHDIDYAVVDSSILLSLFYMPYDFPPSFRQYVEDAYDSYDNINIFLDRNPDLPYVQAGRNENEAQARAIDQSILDYFKRREAVVKLWRVTTGPQAANMCYEIVHFHKKPTLVR